MRVSLSLDLPTHNTMFHVLKWVFAIYDYKFERYVQQNILLCGNGDVYDFTGVGGLEMRKVKCLIGIANSTLSFIFVRLLKLRSYQSYVPLGRKVLLCTYIGKLVGVVFFY